MNILAIDTAGEPLSLALLSGGKVYRFHKVLAKPHDETLIKRVDALLKRAGLRIDELDAFAAASGPGRFTGIRIGMAFAAVAAGALKKLALAVSRLEAAATRANGALIAVVVPGWRDEKFCQLFARGPKGLAPAEPPVWVDAAGWPGVRAALRDRGAELLEADPTAEDLAAAAAAIIASGRKPAFEPLYLKPAGYEAKAKRQAGAAR